MQEASRTNVVGALWQYIKSNRLQETDDKAGAGGNSAALSGIAGIGVQPTRQIINANSDLIEIFGGDEKIQFHQIMEKLNNHLSEIDPIVFNFTVGSPALFKSSKYSSAKRF
mmetsp:Transcript_13662/g.21400  ORF Transcript_13662/g.21400 Transcript_13662/m.21400 type:complete len:112 (+) Transcript_13662:992-1327(+)